MEPNFSYEQCEALGILLESYIRMLLAAYPVPKEADDFNPLIENLKSFLESNLEYDIDLSRLAKTFHYNEKYFSLWFLLSPIAFSEVSCLLENYSFLLLLLC